MEQKTESILDGRGNALANVPVLIKKADGTPATLFAVSGGAQIDNPIKTDTRGQITFAAANGTYTGITQSTAFPATQIPPFTLFDPADNPNVSKDELASATGTELVNGTWFNGATERVSALATSIGSQLVGHGQAALADVLPVFPGRIDAIAGSKMKIDFLHEEGDFKLEDEAGIWGGETYAFAGFNKEFTASTIANGNGSPAATLFAFANNSGSNADVVALIGDAVARANDSTVFGGNLIVRNDAGISGAKLVGLEIDLEPANGTEMAEGSAGLYLNVFNVASSAPAIQLGSLGGGRFGDGIIVNGVTGAGLAAQSGSNVMASLVDASQGTYSSDAIILGNGHRLRLQGTGSTHAAIYNDASNNVRMVLGAGQFVIRNSSDTSSLFSLDSSGGLTLGSVKVAGNQVLSGRVTGWSALTGSATKGGFDTASVTLPQLAQVVKAIVDAGIGHGFIGA